MTTGLAVLFTVIGIVIGSFLNVCIDRLPLRKSIVSSPSHCDSCQRRIAPVDLIPLLNYVWLRGRCRYCHARISLRVPLVELLTGALFFLAFWRFVLSPGPDNYAAFAVSAFWCCVFLLIIFIDWEHKLILNKVTYPMAVVALVFLAIDSLMPGSNILGNLAFLPQDKPSILSGVIGGAVGFTFFLLVFLINQRGMGLGDVKLAGLIGLVTGWPLVIVGLLIGILTGGLVAIVALALRLKGRKDVIPYGTFLAIGPVITLFWGIDIFHWYQGLFGFSLI
jgi:leader peptidase (prepilin peptidase) / N-methyltransferase